MLLSILTLACAPSPVVNNYYTNVYEVGSDTGDGTETIPGAESDTGWQNIEPPNELVVTSTVAELALDPFATDGVVYWFGVSETQVAQMNDDWENAWYEDWYGAVYEVDDEGDSATGTDHLYIRTPNGNVADYGECQTNVVGQSSGVTWTSTTIPNLSLDSNEFVDDQYFNTEEQLDHIRLNNGGVGSMFGEPLALAIWDAAGVPVPRSSYAFVGGTPWQDEDLLIPYIAIEVYKPTFCVEHADYFGGGCSSIWEWYGYDISAGNVSSINQYCEVHDGCTTTRLTEFATVVDEYAYQTGFMAATEDYFDWDSFQTQMCLSWYAQTGDDYVHNLNNIVMTEGNDGKFRIHPWSMDINAGLAWGGAWTGMDLWGWSTMSMSCQYDAECWQETIDRCGEVLDLMETVDPANTLLPELYERLSSTMAPWGDDGGDSMIRSPDEGMYSTAYAFYADRVELARAELALYEMPTSGCGPWDTGCWDTGF